MRRKLTVYIILIVVILTVANFAAGMFFTQNGLYELMDKNLLLARGLANDSISTKIGLLKADAQTIAARIGDSAPTEEDIESLMGELLEQYPEFLSLTLFDKNGIVAECGRATTAEYLLQEKYIQEAFTGRTVISTTRTTQTTRELVMNVCTPVGDSHVLTATISGMTFTDMLSPYKLWDTGNLLMTDEEGTIIADGRFEYMVRDRWNFIELAKDSSDKEIISVGKVFDAMINSDEGTGELVYQGVERFCTYERISASEDGWRLALMAPTLESPAMTVQQGLIVSSLFFLAIGIIAAPFISKRLALPYNQIEEQKQRLEEMNVIALTASEAKSAFLANMSHEMRTPLNAVVGLSELTLAADTLSGDDRENTEKIYGAGMALLGIVNDILDLSKIESGKLELVKAPYDTPSFINDVTMINEVRIGSKPIVFNVDAPEDFPARLLGDEMRVKQMCNNLLSNAFKYSKEGQVDWKLRAERSVGGFLITCTVSDTGIGITPENLSRLFQNYSRVDLEVNHHIEGTGLGLSITKQLVESMGGTITAESVYGKGSTFTLHFEQGYAGEATIGADIAAHLKDFKYIDRNRTRNLNFVRVKMPYAKILVVDDVVNNLDVVRGILKPYGMQVDCVMDGQSAIDCIKSEKVHYDAIFMDHMMPEMDGVEATRIIREEIGTEYAQTIPILALTANAIEGNEAWFLQNGFQAFLSKPIDIMAMDAVLRKWVRDKDKEASCSKDGQETVADGDTTLDTAAADEPNRRNLQERRSGYDRRFASKEKVTNPRGGLFSQLHVAGIDVALGLGRFGGDEEIYLEILTSYVDNTPALCKQLPLLEKTNREKYIVVLHGIKGSSRNIGAELIGAKLESLEKAARANNNAYIEANGAAVVHELSHLLSAIEAALHAVSGAGNEKPKREAPDAAVLARLKEACAAFDMTSIDTAMDELKRYDYTTGAGLVTWLSEQVLVMGFDEIVERLSRSTE
ncbi:MAG: response regulator [Coriobacteriales bacterium]|jgi:signal transduction histidine kinase/CheY-like chemotaxis protein|nr:response regulator [Coriobacteriales bacterium]